MIDLILGTRFRRLVGRAVADPRASLSFGDFTATEYVYIMPGELILAETANIVSTGSKLGLAMPCSTYLRCGLGFGAGFVKPGWNQQLVLELWCVHDIGLKVYVGDAVGQVALLDADASSISRYTGHHVLEPRTKFSGTMVWACPKCEHVFSGKVEDECPRCGELR